MTALPYYSWWDQLPAHLKTKTQLDTLGLKPGGPIRARIAYGRGRRARDYALYDQREAVAKRVPTEAQRAALQKAQLARRTCQECGTVKDRPGALDAGGRCWGCVQRAEEMARKADQDEMIVWARHLLLDDPASVIIIDTETTDLHGRLCEVAVIDLAGHVLLDTLVNPQTPILATHIHGITDAMVQDAPTFAQVTPALRQVLSGKRVAAYNADYDRDVLRDDALQVYEHHDPNPTRVPFEGTWGTPEYEAALTAWRAAFDAWERRRNAALHWITSLAWIDVMEPYSQYCGEWSDYHQDYRWQPLWGEHRALGDCRACLAVIQRMAATPLAIEARLRKRRGRVYDAGDEQEPYISSHQGVTHGPGRTPTRGSTSHARSAAAGPRTHD